MASETVTTALRELDEHRLVQEAQQGHLDAMRPILERYAQPLYSTVILPRLGDAASAEDVLRDTLATAVEKIRRFTWQGTSIYPWLRQIAINKVYDVHRQSKRSRRLADAMIHDVAAGSDPAHQADAQLIADQERRAHKARIDETMQRIAERYRLAIDLRLVQELPRQDCAARLGITVGTFDVLLFRAVRAFRKQFGEHAEPSSRDPAEPSDGDDPGTTGPTKGTPKGPTKGTAKGTTKGT